MEKISYKGEGRIQACVSVRDYFKLRPVRNKTGVHIKILKKGGLPVRMIRCRKKKAFAAGLLLGGILVLFLSGRIWNIQISGNIKNSTPEILKYLEKEEIVHGMSKKKGKLYTACCLCAKRLSGYYLGICQDHRL